MGRLTVLLLLAIIDEIKMSSLICPHWFLRLNNEFFDTVSSCLSESDNVSVLGRVNNGGTRTKSYIRIIKYMLLPEHSRGLDHGYHYHRQPLDRSDCILSLSCAYQHTIFAARARITVQFFHVKTISNRITDQPRALHYEFSGSSKGPCKQGQLLLSQCDLPNFVPHAWLRSMGCRASKQHMCSRRGAHLLSYMPSSPSTMVVLGLRERGKRLRSEQDCSN